MSHFFNAYIMIGCSCYFLLTSAFLPDLPLRPAGAIYMTFFFEFSCFLVTFRNFQGSEWVFSVPGSKIKAKNIKINWGNPPKVLRKYQLVYQLAIFRPNF